MAAETGATSSRVLNKLAFALANSETSDVTTLATNDRIPVSDTSADGQIKWTTPDEIRRGEQLSQTPVVLSASTILTKASHEGRWLLMGAAGAALTFTLPAATGTGDTYKFAVSVVNTSNYLIKVPTGSQLMKGQIIGQSSSDSATDQPRTWVPASTDDTITLNGTTTGGQAIGNYIEITDCSSIFWLVRGLITQSGAEATPFSDTVT